jgi:hypothetical protein
MLQEKTTINDLAAWLGYSVESILMAKELVDISDPDGAYSLLDSMGQFEAAEVITAIWFEYGSLDAALNMCDKFRE